MKREAILRDFNNTDANIVDFGEYKEKLKLAGKEPPSGESENWLKELPVGCVFVCRDKTGQDAKKIDLKKFMVTKHYDKVTDMSWFHPTGQTVQMTVATLEFSRFTEFFEVLFVVIFDQEKEQENGSSGSIQPPGVGADEVSEEGR
jgi:hypothetical protein